MCFQLGAFPRQQLSLKGLERCVHGGSVYTRVAVSLRSCPSSASRVSHQERGAWCESSEHTVRGLPLGPKSGGGAAGGAPPPGASWEPGSPASKRHGDTPHSCPVFAVASREDIFTRLHTWAVSPRLGRKKTATLGSVPLSCPASGEMPHPLPLSRPQRGFCPQHPDQNRLWH